MMDGSVGKLAEAGRLHRDDARAITLTIKASSTETALLLKQGPDELMIAQLGARLLCTPAGSACAKEALRCGFKGRILGRGPVRRTTSPAKRDSLLDPAASTGRSLWLATCRLPRSVAISAAPSTPG
jgi:hypothetical protein